MTHVQFVSELRRLSISAIAQLLYLPAPSIELYTLSHQNIRFRLLKPTVRLPRKAIGREGGDELCT